MTWLHDVLQIPVVHSMVTSVGAAIVIDLVTLYKSPNYESFFESFSFKVGEVGGERYTA